MPVQCRSISRSLDARCYHEEMKAFVGVINIRILTLTNTRSTGLLPPNYHFFVVFTWDRFLQICWMLHVGDLTATTIFG